MTFLRIYINKICLKRSCWYHDVRVCDANSHHSITLWCAMCVFYYTFFWCLRVFPHCFWRWWWWWLLLLFSSIKWTGLKAIEVGASERTSESKSGNEKRQNDRPPNEIIIIILEIFFPFCCFFLRFFWCFIVGVASATDVVIFLFQYSIFSEQKVPLLAGCKNKNIWFREKTRSRLFNSVWIGIDRLQKEAATTTTSVRA